MPGELPPSPESPQGTEAERPSKHPRHDRRANVMPLSRRERARRHAYTITALLLLLILSLVAARFIRVRTRPPARKAHLKTLPLPPALSFTPR